MNISLPEEIIKSIITAACMPALNRGDFRGYSITCTLLEGPSKRGRHFEDIDQRSSLWMLF